MVEHHCTSAIWSFWVNTSFRICRSQIGNWGNFHIIPKRWGKALKFPLCMRLRKWTIGLDQTTKTKTAKQGSNMEEWQLPTMAAGVYGGPLSLDRSVPTPGPSFPETAPWSPWWTWSGLDWMTCDTLVLYPIPSTAGEMPFSAACIYLLLLLSLCWWTSVSQASDKKTGKPIA